MLKLIKRELTKEEQEWLDWEALQKQPTKVLTKEQQAEARRVENERIKRGYSLG